MLLSILICHLTNRKLLLERLMRCIQPQVDKANENGPVVEVLIEADTGKITTGEKRNILLSKASGVMSCFIDDDDLVNSRYAELILEGIRSKPELDCVGFYGMLYRDGCEPRKFKHSMQYKDWFEKDRVYYRSINHLNPVKTSLARQVGYKPITVGEDRDFSMRLIPFLGSEWFINDHIMYEYYA